MSNFRLKICRQINDVDGTERAFFGTDTAADAETFGNIGDLGLWGNLNTELAGSDHRARLLALLTAFLNIVSRLRQRSKVQSI